MKLVEHDKVILPSYVDFWENEHFNFEKFITIDPETGEETTRPRTHFNYIQFLKVLIAKKVVEIQNKEETV